MASDLGCRAKADAPSSRDDVLEAANVLPSEFVRSLGKSRFNGT